MRLSVWENRITNFEWKKHKFDSQGNGREIIEEEKDSEIEGELDLSEHRNTLDFGL
jgi:hypothetical protein